MNVAFFDILGEATIFELHMKNEGNFKFIFNNF